MISAADTNTLLDALVPSSVYYVPALQRLEAADAAGEIIVSEPVLAELAANFLEAADLFRFLAETHVRLESSSAQTLMLAGMRWQDYQGRRPAGFPCAACGNRQQIACSRCGAQIRSRQHIIADFIIGAHALLQADVLLTRDRGYFRTYFPDLTVS